MTECGVGEQVEGPIASYRVLGGENGKLLRSSGSQILRTITDGGRRLGNQIQR